VSARRDPAARVPVSVPSASFYVETLGCPKNAVDSDKVVASLLADGLVAASDPSEADVVVVNTCAFIEAARQESIEVALALADVKRAGAKLVVTGCMAERYGAELAAALPEADAVVGFAGEGAIADIALGPTRRKPVGVRDLLELPRPAPRAPWAYVKIAEGCDRACAFCAIPSFRGKQRSRTPESIEAEARALVDGGVAEIVLVAQDLAWYGRDAGEPGSLAPGSVRGGSAGAGRHSTENGRTHDPAPSAASRRVSCPRGAAATSSSASASSARLAVAKLVGGASMVSPRSAAASATTWPTTMELRCRSSSGLVSGRITSSGNSARLAISRCNKPIEVSSLEVPPCSGSARPRSCGTTGAAGRSR